MHLLDIFEVDANTFATVLELCPGGDLDSHLKEHGVRSAADVVVDYAGGRSPLRVCAYVLAATPFFHDN